MTSPGRTGGGGGDGGGDDDGDGRLLILAADHRARGVATIEHYGDLLAALRAASAHCDGVLATAQPLADLAADGGRGPHWRTYLSLNRTGLAGTAFELDDRLVATVGRAAADGWTGVKLMTRIAPDDPDGAAAIELLGRVLEESRAAGLEALVEPILWRDGRMSRSTDDVVLAAVVAHDLGSPLLKVPVPDVAPGAERAGAVRRVVEAVGVPVLFLGGPRRSADEPVEDLARDVVDGGGGGLAVGRAVIEDPDPAAVAARLAGIVHPR